jgi:hypothetical protein
MSGSGTDYTRTTNLQLYKPIYDMDAENWGTHLNWNADVLDGLFPQGASGTYLPLSGGTMTGGLIVDGPAEAASFKRSSTSAPGVQITPIGMYDTLPTNTSTQQVFSWINLGQGRGGTYFTPTFSGKFGATVYGSLDQSAIGLIGQVDFSGNGGVGQHAGIQAYANRYKNIAQPTTTVSTTLSSPAATISIADVSMFQYEHQPILINGNPYLQVAHSGTSGPGTISVERNIPVADGTAGNTVTGQANPSLWGLNININDDTGGQGITSSKLSNYLVGCELDLQCSGLDDSGPLTFGSPGGVRSMMIMIGVGGTSGNPAEIGDGIVIGPSGGSNISWKRFYRASGTFSQSAFDTRGATEQTSARAVWLATGHRIAFDTAGAVVMTSADGATLQSNNAMQVGGLGVLYSGPPPGAQQAYIAFGWDGSNLLAWHNNNTIGALASQSWVSGQNYVTGGPYLPTAGGTLSGALSGNGTINAQTNAGGWGSNNFGKQLLVTVGGPATHPAIGITDVNGVNLWGICNASGTLSFSAMPAYSNSTTAPNTKLQMSTTGMGFNGTAPIAKPTVTGAKGGNAALTSLMTALANYGLVTDSTS